MFFDDPSLDLDGKWTTLAKFVSPWKTGPLLEPIIHRAVEFKQRVRAHARMSLAHSQGATTELITDGIAIIEDLEATAVKIKAFSNLEFSQQPRAFNNMFVISTQTTEAIARCHYRAVRYHIVELILHLSNFIQQEAERSRLESVCKLHKSLRSLIRDQICTEIDVVLGPDGHIDIKDGDPGLAYRAYGMFWPLLILLFSSSNNAEKKTWVREKLQSSGNNSGYGLATWTADRIDMFHSCCDMH